MESFFTRNRSETGRFFFIFGHTNDWFCEDNLIRVNLDYIIYKHLKDIGYKRIIFYSMDEQLYFYDIDSFNWTRRPNEALKEKPVTRPVIRSNRLPGPIPGKLKPFANTSGQNHASERIEPLVYDGKLHFGKMEASTAFERIDHCVRDREKTEIETAAIFTNADDFIKHFVEDINRRVFDSFNTFDRLGPDNHNIVLFIFPKGAQSKIAADYKDSFFEKKITEANTIIISPPTSAEIRNAINHYRLRRGLKVDFTCLDIVCKRIARELCKANFPLEWLMIALNDKIIENNLLLDTDGCDTMFGKKDNETAIQKLDKLVGMENVKKEIRALENILKNRAERNPSEVSDYTDFKSRLVPVIPFDKKRYNMHYILTGNPGTGKTTVAKLLGDIYYELGYLESGHTVEVTRDDLVAGFVGQTAIKTKEKIEEAMGGVLFIDEAYSLAKGGENDFGPEAVSTLVEAMTDRNGRFAVVVAGYPQEMEEFLNLNPGLKDRFESTLHIEDYSPSELLDIFNMNMSKEKFGSSENLSNIVTDFLKNWHSTRDKNWSNARGIEKLINRMYKNWELRGGEKTDSSDPILDIVDIPTELQQYCKPSQELKEDAMKELNKLTGLAGVKEMIGKLKRKVKYEHKTEPGHYIFAGNPGTGKTTVARLLGDILREEGVLKRGHVVPVGRVDLVAGYEGQSAIKTEKKLKEAIDGILFIDEAYSLYEGGREHGFAKEVINTIVPFMENNRSRICVICAGYTKDMEDFIQSNDGFTSRFKEIINFDDYDTEELVNILQNFGKDFILQSEYIQKSRQIFDYWIRNKTRKFGNARDVRKYFDKCTDVLYERLDTEFIECDIPVDTRKTLTGQDIPLEYMAVVKSEPVATDNHY